MNPSITQSSNLYLPLNSLNPLCLQLHKSLSDPNVSQRERCNLEQSLWTKIKDTRKLDNEALLRHFIGFYQTILLAASKKTNLGDTLYYHVSIRLGDLNRYIKQFDVAGYYYCNARNLIPSYGHAYNQLGLLTDSTEIYKRCYYYARAAKSSERPLKNIADSNLRIAVNEVGCELLERILNYPDHIDAAAAKQVKLPETALQWFHAMVVAIYADNIKPIAKLFLRYLSENYSTQRSSVVSRDGSKTTTVYCDIESYLLLASHDILLDWLRLGSQGNQLIPALSSDLRKIRSSLQTILLSVKYELSNTSNDGSLGTSTRDLTSSSSKSADTDSSSAMLCESVPDSAEPFKPDLSASTISDRVLREPSGERVMIHDYVLRGFGPLNRVHDELTFSMDPVELSKSRLMEQSNLDQASSQKFIESDQLVSILTRIKAKTDVLAPPVKRQTRNIALQSILSINDANNG